VLLTLWRSVEWLLAVVFLFITLQLIEYYGPDRDQRRWHWISTGTLVSVALWLAASGGLRVYVQYFGNFTRTYGSLGAAILLLLWFYMVGLSALIGGVINGVIWKASEGAAAGP
jgi:membrane protein